MKKILLQVIGTVLCLVFVFQSFSQKFNSTIGKITISSPNAASLGKYGDIPVSYHTGIPNIDIPIYTVKSGSLELPISMSYHASGLKVQEQASWVGAGWSLNAGGCITRSVMGAPDDRGLNFFTDKGYFSDYGYNSYLFSPGRAVCQGLPTKCPTGRDGMMPSSYPPQDAYVQTGILDGEPDFYFFNFNGHSGKFYFNDDRTPMIEPEQDLQITPIYTEGDQKGITGFIITTPDGTQYHFGKNPNNDGNIDATEITYNLTSQSPYNTNAGAASSWFLNEITSSDGQFSIQLVYKEEKYSYYTLSMYPIPQMQDPGIFAYPFEYDIDKNFIDGVRLTQIVFENGWGTIDFDGGELRKDMSEGTLIGTLTDNPNNDKQYGARTLSSIAIKADNFCKKFTFYYDYFTDESSLNGWLANDFRTKDIQSDKYRLKLTSIQETSCDNSIVIPPYRFAYEGNNVTRKLSFGIDHWGFPNGVVHNLKLIPQYTILPTPGQSSGSSVTTVPGADRDAHWPLSKQGMLTQITYPTGGKSSFEYESNSVAGTKKVNTGYKIADFSYGYTSSDNSTNPVTFTAAFGVSSYSINIKSDQEPFPGETPGQICAILRIEATDNPQNYYYFTVEQGGSKQVDIVLTPFEEYKVTFSVNCPVSTGHGASAYIFVNQYTDISANVEVGGPRIKSITDIDKTSEISKITSYGYNYDNEKDGLSSGKLFSIPVYVQGLRNDAWQDVNGTDCSLAGCFTCFGSNVSFYQSPSSIRPMATSQGNHIGYGEVYVSQTNNGYSQYKYYIGNRTFAHKWDQPLADVCVRTVGTFCDPNLPNSPAPPASFDPWRGELASQAIYSEEGRMLKTVSYNPYYDRNPIQTPGIISRFYITGYQLNLGGMLGKEEDMEPALHSTSTNMTPVGVQTFTEYFLQTWRKTQDNTETKTYEPVTGKYVTETSTINYGSDYHHEPTQTITSNSKGSKLITNVNYSFDFRLNHFTAPDCLGIYNANIHSDEQYLSSTLANTK